MRKIAAWKRSFDWMARPYRWLEYASFGRALERCRFHLLSELSDVQSALVLGDGDGRFTARLLAAAPQARVLAVDGSPAMLQALYERCRRRGLASRVTLCCADLTDGLPGDAAGGTYDLVATHFFLDCLSEAHIQRLAEEVLPTLTPEARWVVSEFHVPHTALRHIARGLVRGLYLAFRLLTGLQTQQLPQYGAVFASFGLTRQQYHPSLGAILVSELWTIGDHDAPAAPGKIEVR